MNYYDNLYDIDFYSCNSYVAMVNDSSITIYEPGFPDWLTWHGAVLNADDAKQIWLEFKAKNVASFSPDYFREILMHDDHLLLALIMCEEAYRNHDSISFILLNRILIISGIEELRLKAIKLHYAWFALSCLGLGDQNPLNSITTHCFNYLQEALLLSNVTKDKLKVEQPVKSEWEERKVSHNDREGVETFYKTTHSYILELTAANHQVETLFNYCIVLDLIKRLGVRSVLDYGAGIGTFVLLAHYYDIKATYMDLQSVTMRYFIERSKSKGIEIPFKVIHPREITIPNGIDCIVCTEVLEHIFDPEYLIQKFYSSLRSHGILVVSESFDYVDAFCSHLPQHNGKGGEVFLTYLKNIGFKQIPIGFGIHPTLHIKV